MIKFSPNFLPIFTIIGKRAWRVLLWRLLLRKSLYDAHSANFQQGLLRTWVCSDTYIHSFSRGVAMFIYILQAHCCIHIFLWTSFALFVYLFVAWVACLSCISLNWFDNTVARDSCEIWLWLRLCEIWRRKKWDRPAMAIDSVGSSCWSSKYTKHRRKRLKKKVNFFVRALANEVQMAGN